MNTNRDLHGFAVFVIWFFFKVLRLSGSTLRIPAFVLIGSLLLQVVLGAVAIWSRKAALPTTSHIVCGAFTLAAWLWLAIFVFRILISRPEARADSGRCRLSGNGVLG